MYVCTLKTDPTFPPTGPTLPALPSLTYALIAYLELPPAHNHQSTSQPTNILFPDLLQLKQPINLLDLHHLINFLPLIYV